MDLRIQRFTSCLYQFSLNRLKPYWYEVCCCLRDYCTCWGPGETQPAVARRVANAEAVPGELTPVGVHSPTGRSGPKRRLRRKRGCCTPGGRGVHFTGITGRKTVI
jgi:hypothetical protein